MTLGADPEFARSLAKYKRLHVRVSLKGTSEEEYHELTGAIPSSYRLPFLALAHLIDAGVSCNACVMVSFSSPEGVADVKQQLEAVHPGILKSLELEKITLFPKVAERLAKAGLKPTSAKRIRGRRAVDPTTASNRTQPA